MIPRHKIIDGFFVLRSFLTLIRDLHLISSMGMVDAWWKWDMLDDAEYRKRNNA